MKHRILPLIFLAVGVMIPMTSFAKDVYVYSPTGADMGMTANVKRIVFDNGKMTLVPETGENVDIELSDLGRFSFKSLVLSGISVAENVDITLTMNNDILSVASNAEISEIRVYNVFGTMTEHCSPAAYEATMEIGTRGVSIVLVTAGGITRTYKIAR